MILIIDDNIEEKIGAFKDLLEKTGFKCIEAKTLEEAKRIFEDNINNIDAVVLDYAFPESKNNTIFYNENKVPNGIVFLKKYEFKLYTKNIPLIINTSADEEEREKWLRTTSYFSKDEDVLYKCPAKQPLADSTSVIAEQIIKEIKKRQEERKMLSRIKADNKWTQKGQTGIYDKTTGEYHYLRNGD